VKRLYLLSTLVFLLAGTSGCRICECTQWAWNSRFNPQPQQPVSVTQPYVVSDTCYSPAPTACSPCGTSCGAPSNTAPMITSPVPVK
jgi:hypothetical protein